MRAAILIAVLLATPAHANLITISAADFAFGTDVSRTTEGVTLSTFTSANGLTVYNPLLTGTASLVENYTVFAAALANGGVRPSFKNMLDAIPCIQSADCAPRDEFSLLRIDFTAPTNYVEIGAVLRSGATHDPSALWAFDVTGALLGGCHIPSDSLVETIGSEARSWLTSEMFGSNTGIECGEMTLATGPCEQDDLSIHCRSYEYSARIEIPADSIAFAVFGGYAHGWSHGYANRVTYSVPEPGTLALLGAGLIPLLWRRRK